MARLYISVNGDDVGSKIGDAIASNDHMALQQVSGALKNSHNMIEEWVTSKGGQVISSSGDEGLYIIPEESIQELDQIRAKYSEMSGHTITVGVGNSMADASKAMIYGKLNNKDQVVHYEPMIDDYLSDSDLQEAESTEQVPQGQEDSEQPMMDEQSSMDPETPSDVSNMQGGAVAEGQPDQILNEEQLAAAPTENVPEMTGDPNDNTENPDNEVGEPGDIMQDDNSVDEYEKTVPEDAIDEIVQQEENRDIAGEKEMSPKDEMTNDAIEGELDDIDKDNIEHDEEVGNEEEDALVGMVRQDMDQAVGEGSGIDSEMPEEEMPEEEMSQDDEHADLKASVMDCLHMFKQHKQDLDMLGTQNPELHEALIYMLQHMIEMGRRLTEGNAGDVDEAEELNQFAQEFPDAEHEDAEADQGIAEENVDQHNEEEHGEDPDEDSAIENDEDPETDATPEENMEDDGSNNNPFPPKKDDGKEKLEKK